MGGGQPHQLGGAHHLQRGEGTNQFRRNDLRSADMHTNINYYATSRVPNRASATGDATYTAPDNDRKNKEASWLASQAWFEGLRHYPQGPDAMDSEAAYSGLTHGGSEDAMPTEHLETDLRTRLGIAVADPDWRPAQLQEAWAPENPSSRSVSQNLRASSEVYQQTITTWRPLAITTGPTSGHEGCSVHYLGAAGCGLSVEVGAQLNALGRWRPLRSLRPRRRLSVRVLVTISVFRIVIMGGTYNTSWRFHQSTV